MGSRCRIVGGYTSDCFGCTKIVLPGLVGALVTAPSPWHHCVTSPSLVASSPASLMNLLIPFECEKKARAVCLQQDHRHAQIG